MARKKSQGTELAVFKGREAKLNRAIFKTLATEGPQNTSSLQKQLNKQKGLDGTYHSSLIKRIRRLEETGYITQVAKTETKGVSKAVVYKLRQSLPCIISKFNQYGRRTQPNNRRKSFNSTVSLH